MNKNYLFLIAAAAIAFAVYKSRNTTQHTLFTGSILLPDGTTHYALSGDYFGEGGRLFNAQGVPYN